MAQLNSKKEVIIYILLLIPFVYAGIYWNKLPATIPVHFGLDGTANNWGGKSTIWLLPILAVFNYLIALVICYITVKQVPQVPGKMLFIIRLLIVVLLFPVMMWGIHKMATG